MATVFLDLDGTLIDPRPGIIGSVVHALTALGIAPPPAEDLEWVIGPPLIDSFARLGAPDPAAALDIYRARYTDGAMFDLRIYDGIPQALQALRRGGHRLVLATAKPHVFATRITARLGLDRHLAAQFGPELDGTRNDKAALLAHALPLVGADAAASVMVGDRHHDREAAQANAMAFVGVSWGYGSPGELFGAAAICDAPSDLPDVITAVASGFPHADS